MDPLTHLLTGAALARTGFNRRAAYATVAMVLAADAPDLDTLWAVRGPLISFEHHRGWTHSLVGVPVDALVALAFVWLIHRWRVGRGKMPVAPVRWGFLYGLCLLAACSHLLLDFTNSYGVRPFFPFDPRWFNAGLVFIFDPLIFGALLLAVVAPPLFALVSSEVGARRQVFRGRGWAVFALLFMVGMWGLRAVEHAKAETIVRAQEDSADPILRVSVNPYPVSPFRWQSVAETATAYRVADVNTLNGSLSDAEMIYKPTTTLATLAAKRSELGKIYLDWSTFPIVQDIGTGAPPEDAPVAGQLNTVVFGDLRFRYPTPIFGRAQTNPLGATALVDQEHRVVDMRMSSVTGVGRKK